jgi:superfamily I DNA/RNA helicase
VFFIGLEDGAFWNFKKTPDQEMNAFYVAISRAKKKIVFTFSGIRKVGKQSRQSTNAIGTIYELMKKAEVQIRKHDVEADTDATAT